MNWFRKGQKAGKFVWPGYGDNMRVLKWMIDRIEGQAQGQETMFGVAPQYAEINWTGLDFSAQQFAAVTSIDKAAWAEEFKLHGPLRAAGVSTSLKRCWTPRLNSKSVWRPKQICQRSRQPTLGCQ